MLIVSYVNLIEMIWSKVKEHEKQNNKKYINKIRQLFSFVIRLSRFMLAEGKELVYVCIIKYGST